VMSGEVELCAISSRLVQFRCPPTGKCAYVLYVQPQIHIVSMVVTNIVHAVAHGRLASTKSGTSARLARNKNANDPQSDNRPCPTVDRHRCSEFMDVDHP
jgi:hypothetical protein